MNEWKSFLRFWERRWVLELNWWGDSSGYAGKDDGYEYRLKRTRNAISKL